ncbi:MAG: carbon-nitrogen hydrolase [Pyrinomonadaceae bacterium]|nr:carbon-nitrogen hydrolase [Sphingobacteriaceae bacterium]
MENNINIAIVQFTPVWNNKAENYKRLDAILENLQGDIVVLPELCTTGYSFLTKQEALAAADTATETADYFQVYSNKNNAVIVAGFAEKKKDEVYNSAIIVSPDKPYEVYRKTHLFFKEKDCFATGNTGFKVIRHPLKDCIIGVMVCYDWRFPESARTLALMGADVIACPANLVTSVWEIGMKSRALENNVFVAVSNRCGTEKRMLANGTEQQLTFYGKSVVYNINGAELIQADSKNETILTYKIDISESRNKKFNEYNDIFKDRNPSLYKLS